MLGISPTQKKVKIATAKYHQSVLKRDAKLFFINAKISNVKEELLYTFTIRLRIQT